MRPSSLLRCTRQLALSAMSSVQTRRGRQRSVSTGFIVLSRAASSDVGMASHQNHDNLRIQARSMHPISMHMTSNYHHRRRDTPNSPRMSAMQMATVSHYTSDTSSANLVESLNDNAKSAYHELTKLSEKIRKLDDLYYGGANKSDDDNGSDGDEIFNQMQQADIMSDDEYDALARREAELCTLYPHLLKLLEEESGLGIRATRYGGRVGQVYNKKQQQQEAEIEKKTKQKKASSKTKTKKSTTKKRVKRKHLQNAPMLSLDNAMDDADAVSWLTRMRRLLLSSTKDDIVDDTNDESNDSSSTAQSTTIQIMAEPKIDGLSLSLRYQLVVRNECSSSDDCVYEFVWGATRGDGTQGEDVTKAVQSAWMRNTTTGAAGSSPEEESDDHFSIPKTFAIPPKAETTIDAPSLIEVRGEVVLPQKAFDDFTHNTINEAADNSTSKQPTYSNARNAASGILLRSKEPTSEEEIEQTRFLQSRLEFYAYDIVASTTSSSSMEPSAWLDVVVGENGSEMRESLTKFGFHVPIPVVMESLEISLDQEMNETDVPNLLDYHRRLMQARDESVGSSVRTRKSSAIEESDFPYQIDGVVYKLSSFTSRRVCGSSSRTPRWAIAHKFPPQCAVTRLVDIEVQVGRTGALTPVAILEPVDLGGVMVSRASLHNFHFARKMLLPKSGASGVDEEGKNDGNANSGSMMSVRKGVSVLVSRAGDVIPQVMKRVFDDGEENEVASTESSDDMISLDAPSKCPACGSPTSFDFVSSASKMTKPKKKPKKKKTDLDDESDHVVDETTQQKSTTQTSSDEEEKIDDTDSGKVLRCSGPQLLCQPRAVNALVYAYSRAGLDVKGISKSKLRHLMEENIIRFPADLFTTFGNISGEDSSKEEDGMLSAIAGLPGWGDLSSQNLAESVHAVASEGVPLSRYIYALGIPLVGTQASQLVAKTYGNVNSFLKALEDASLYDSETAMGEEDEEPPKQPFAALIGDDVKGIGPKAITSLLAFSTEEVLLKAAKDLAHALTIHDDTSKGVGSSSSITSSPFFEGMTIVFTGALPDMSRAKAQSIVKALGAKATPNTVSKSTTLVVEGDKGGKKAKQARELGIRVIDSDEFMEMIKD